MLRLSCCLLLVTLVFLPLHVCAQEGRRPRKIVNIKAGLGYHGVQTEGNWHCTEPDRATGVFGLQTAIFPFTAEFSFYTNLAIEAYAGGWWPAVRVGPGWGALHGGLFWRSSMETSAREVESLCDGPTLAGLEDAFGAGITLEYLLYQGYLGFFVETRQTFDYPVSTTVTAGITVSPLLWLYFRDY
jgi:hypothetical protein